MAAHVSLVTTPDKLHPPNDNPIMTTEGYRSRGTGERHTWSGDLRSARLRCVRAVHCHPAHTIQRRAGARMCSLQPAHLMYSRTNTDVIVLLAFSLLQAKRC